MGLSKIAVTFSLVALAFVAPAAVASLQPDYPSGAFMSNGGKFRQDVAFAAQLPTHEVFVLRDGRVLHSFPMQQNGISGDWVVVETLAGAKAPRARSEPASAFVDESAQALEWREAWPGIDMQIQIVDGHTERVFRVAPGVSPAKIAMAYEGVRFVSGSAGNLSARAGLGSISLSAPVAFQDTDRGRIAVDVDYVVRNNGSLVSFRLGAYDHNLPLTIDPLLQSTYLGHGGQGGVTSMALDPATGDLIAAGFVSIGIPGAAGGFQSVEHDNMAFIARIDSKLRRVIQATYLGETFPTMVARVAVHPITGEIYVAGDTQFGGFPGGGGGANPVLGGSRHDGFVSRFSADLRQLRQTTFTGQDLQYVIARDLAINATSGDVYVVGDSPSAAVVLRFNRDLTAQTGRHIIQGNSFSYGTSLAINQSSGDVYAAVYTSSTAMPGTTGGAEASVPGDEPVSYVARLGADLNQVIQSTFVTEITPGPLPHTVNRYMPLIAINPASGEIYVAGWCWNRNVATMGGALPNYLGGDDDVMVTRLAPDLKQKRGSTYFGGSGFEELGALAFTPDGAHVYIAGFTFSPDLAGAAGGAFPTASSGGAYVARFSASLATLEQSTYFSSLGNTSGFALLVHPTTGEVYLGGESVDGIPGLAGGLQPNYDSPDHFFGSAFLARFDALLSGGDDAVADVFSFVDQFGVAGGAPVVSAPIHVEGISVPVLVTATNGEFSVDGDPFSSASRTVVQGQTIRVRHTSAVGAGATNSTVLNVGSVSDNFVSTTASGTDSTPAAFSFPARDPVVVDSLIESAPVTVTGVDAPATISIVNGEYSIDGGVFTSAAGTINGGQSVIVRHRSATAMGTVTQSQLTIGGVSVTFRSRTDPIDASVHPFAFLDVLNVTPDFDAISDPIVVMGINVPVPVSVVGGEWSTDNIHFSSAPGTVTNLQYIVLRAHTGSGHTTVTVTLTVGDQSDDWVLRQPQLGDTTPDSFTFTNVNDAGLQQWVESNPVSITGIDVPVWVNLFEAEYLDPVSGTWRNQGYLSNGATTKLRVFTSLYPGETVTSWGQIGSANVSWEVQSAGGDPVPDVFDFHDRTDVPVSTPTDSDGVFLSGLVGDTLLSMTGCEMSVNYAPFSASPIRVRNGAALVARLTSSPTASTTTSCTIDIGGVTDTFRVTTVAAPSGDGGGSSGGGGGSSGGGGGSSSGGGGSSSGGGSGSASGGGGGGGGGSFDWLALLLLASLTIYRGRTLATQ